MRLKLDDLGWKARWTSDDRSSKVEVRHAGRCDGGEMGCLSLHRTPLHTWSTSSYGATRPTEGTHMVRKIRYLHDKNDNTMKYDDDDNLNAYQKSSNEGGPPWKDCWSTNSKISELSKVQENSIDIAVKKRTKMAFMMLTMRSN